MTLPSTKDVLGEHLFSKVYLLEPERAAQITGVLLGASNEDILHMLEDKNFLKMQMDGVKRVLSPEDDTDVINSGSLQEQPLHSTSSKERLGESLFQKVTEIDPENAAKLTGMILEMDPRTISCLLESPKDLRVAIDRALKVLHVVNIDRRDQLENDKSVLGEELYFKVSQRHPEVASVVTGMLLEMDVVSLQKLLTEPELLESKIQQAVKVLDDS